MMAENYLSESIQGVSNRLREYIVIAGLSQVLVGPGLVVEVFTSIAHIVYFGNHLFPSWIRNTQTLKTAWLKRISRNSDFEFFDCVLPLGWAVFLSQESCLKSHQGFISNFPATRYTYLAFNFRNPV